MGLLRAARQPGKGGKVVVRPHEFDVGALFGALRGMLRPLLTHNSSVSLVFEDPVGVPRLYTDEGKVSQILRNFISNALKFTERGEVRVSAKFSPDGLVTFAVADTGRDRPFRSLPRVRSGRRDGCWSSSGQPRWCWT